MFGHAAFKLQMYIHNTRPRGFSLPRESWKTKNGKSIKYNSCIDFLVKVTKIKLGVNETMLIKSKLNYLCCRNCSKPSLSLSLMWHYSWWTHFDIIWDKYLHTTHYFPQLLGENYGLCNIYSLRTFDQKSSRLMHCLHCTCTMFAWLPSSSPPSFPHPFWDDYCCSRHH